LVLGVTLWKTICSYEKKVPRRKTTYTQTL